MNDEMKKEEWGREVRMPENVAKGEERKEKKQGHNEQTAKMCSNYWLYLKIDDMRAPENVLTGQKNSL